jgi:hypothetical protein
MRPREKRSTSRFKRGSLNEFKSSKKNIGGKRPNLVDSLLKTVFNQQWNYSFGGTCETDSSFGRCRDGRRAFGSPGQG